MKNSIKYLLASTTVVLAISFTACEGPEGPPGENGTDGTASCQYCHNETYQAEIKTQYVASVHGQGANVAYAGGREECSECHSHEGHVAYLNAGGGDFVSPAITNPSAITCKTCHDGHTELDFEGNGTDKALRTIKPVALKIDASTVLDFGESSNTCIGCHQPRTAAPVADEFGKFKITSTHYGPHHGPQAVMLEGMGGYEVTGKDYSAGKNRTHRTGASCTTCHMHTTDGSKGGHTWSVGVAGCTACHSSADESLISSKKEAVDQMMADLLAALKSKGVVDADGELVTGEYNIDVAGAYFNYALISDDKSNGIHNFKYTEALLKNSIESITN